MVLQNNYLTRSQDYSLHFVPMATTRTYGEACAAAHALDLVGERWALLVVRELLLGPKRFTDLRTGIPHASPNVLAQRLKELEHRGIVRRGKLPPPAGSKIYELTEWGRDLEPVIEALGRWGSRSPFRLEDACMSVDSQVLALRTMFHPHAAHGVTASYQLRLGEQDFTARVAEDKFEIERGVAQNPDATVETTPEALAGLVWAGRDLGEAIATGDVRVAGDEAAVRRFLGLFALPDPVGATATAARHLEPCSAHI